LSEHITDWQQLWAYRPVSWLLIPSIVHVLGDEYVLLASFHLGLLAYSFVIIPRWEYFHFSRRQQWIAQLLLFFPAIASSAAFSVVNQLSASLSLAFFATALLVDNQLPAQRFNLIVVSAFFLLSVLSYEISAPLIVTYVLIKATALRRLQASSLLLLAVFPMAIVWQKVIAIEVFESPFSRATSINWLPVVFFFHTTAVSLPTNLISVTATSLVIVGVVFTLIWSAIQSMRPESKTVLATRRVDLRLIFLAGFLSNSALFLLSGSYAQITGYINRGMTGVWISLSLLLVSLLRETKTQLFVLIFVVSANSVFFWLKLVESSEAVHARETVVSEVMRFSQLPSDGSVGLVLDMPCETRDSEFRTVVFCTTWDARGALNSAGLVFPFVSIAEDRVGVSDWLSREVAVPVYLISFDENFRATEIRQLESTQANGIHKELVRTSRLGIPDDPLESCKAELAKIFELRFQIDLTRLYECLLDPY
jgi:hypothetical protein